MSIFPRTIRSIQNQLLEMIKFGERMPVIQMVKPIVKIEPVKPQSSLGRMRLAVATILALGFVLGISSPAAASKTEDSNSDLQVGLYDLPKVLNPAKVGTMVEWTLLYNLSDRLVGGGTSGELEQGVAYKWSVDDQAESITFYLAKDRKFSDGSRITGDDVKESLKYQHFSGGSTKLKLNEHLLSCENSDENSCPGITLINESQIKLNFKAGHLVNPSIFAVADFAIMPAKLIKNGLKDLFSITSGKYYIEKFEGRVIHLAPNNFHPNPVNQKLSITEIPPGTTEVAWRDQSPSTRIIRVPVWTPDTFKDMKSISYSQPFWVRLGFISPKSKLVLNDNLRRNIHCALKAAVESATNSSIADQMLPSREIGINKSALVCGDIKSVSNLALRFVINSYSFNSTQLSNLKSILISKFPKANLDIQVVPSTFLARIKAGDFDVGLAQMSFGPMNIGSALHYFESVYFQGNLPEEPKKLIATLHKPLSTSQRNETLGKIEKFFENSNYLFGLGQARAAFIYPGDVKIINDQLVTGEFEFSSFQK